jgi:hypothetical protein
VQDGSYRVLGHVGQLNAVGSCDCHATFVFPLQHDVGPSSIEPNAETFEFPLDDALVRERLLGIEHDQDQSTSPGDTNDLTTATLTIFGALNNTRQI